MVSTLIMSSKSRLMAKRLVLIESSGDTQGGHNTDAFDVGSSEDIYISNAVV